MKIQQIWISIACITWMTILVGCEQFSLSERQKVVQASHDAVCKTKDLNAMKPFVTESSKPILEISTSITSLSQIFLGNTLSDRIAVECQSTKLGFVDEIKVNEQRYIVRTRQTGAQEVKESVLILENGAWKISLLGL
jgi:hypothetical protein